MATRPVLAALLASPRRQGRSAALLAAFLKPLRAWDIRFFHLSAISVLPCTGCDHCLNHPPDYPCRQRDALPKLVKVLDQADALVLAAPVYYYGFPAQAKAVIDRTYPMYHHPYWQRHARRPAFFLASCASSKRDEFRAIVPEAKAFLNTLAFHYTDALLVTGMDRRDARQRLAGAKIRAERLGRKCARQLRGLP
jgi:multimeric flavodoxin WrbA